MNQKNPIAMQLDILEGSKKAIVHYFDKNGAIRPAQYVRKIDKGKQKGLVVVRGWEGRQFVPPKVRNIEFH